MCTFKRENYIVVPGFAITELKLSGNELLCFSIIYGFCQDGESVFCGSLGYLSSALNITRQNSQNVLKRLIDKDLIVKIEKRVNGVRLCDYRIKGGVIETMTPQQKRSTGGIIETITHNTNNDNIIDNANIDNNNILFPREDLQNGGSKKESQDYKGTTESLCLFKDSRFAAFEAFSAHFNNPEYQNIDIYYYWQTIADWSAANGSKKRDWIATARNWIRSDAEKGKLHKINNGGTALSPDALYYLQMGNKLFND